MRLALARSSGRMMIIGALVALAALWLATASARAAVYQVDTTADTGDVDTSAPACADFDGKCSLRAAIDQANSTSANDRIDLPDGRYVLKAIGKEDDNGVGDLDAGEGDAGDLAIDGQSTLGTIVDANGISRVLQVVGGGDVDVSDLTVTGGAAANGGGILNEGQGTLTLTRVRATRNIADLDGGGLANQGDAVLVDSTFDRNSAGSDGGGICSRGDLDGDGSTVNDNAANRHGGGLLLSTGSCTPAPETSFRVGGFDAVAPTTSSSLQNSTIDGNTADADANTEGDGGGIAVVGGSASLVNVTVTDNASLFDSGGGLYSSDGGSYVLENTLVAENRVSGQQLNCGGQDSGPVTDAGHNLDSGTTCPFTEATSKKNAVAGLARLSDNGGPTHTRALLDGSPAIDAGDDAACPEDDQRGAARPPGDGLAGSACDIGAYEKRSAPASQPPQQQQPAQQPSSQPQQQPQTPQSQAQCSPFPPRTSISRSSLRGSSSRIALIGRSVDFRCAETRLAGNVTTVQVSIARLAGGAECRFLTSGGDLGSARACDDRVMLTAKLGKLRDGKVPWTFRKRRLDLPAGRYVVVAMAKDGDGNTETEIRRFNRKRFKIK